MNIKEMVFDQTVLVLAPTSNDSTIAVGVLADSGIQAVACEDIQQLGAMLKVSYGAILIAEEAIRLDEFSILRKILASQPPWSDIPVILLTGNDIDRTVELFSESGNISLLERPFSKLTLIRSVEVALRARKRQYEVRRLLEDLRQAKEEAERANASKTQFLAHMSHEIRTPIGAIIGFVDLLKNPENDSDEQHKFMSVIESNSKHLLRLIDDILDLSKVEAGKMTTEMIQFSLAELLADFGALMDFRAREKGIFFDYQYRSQIPNVICSDPVRLKQILTNLVGNAIKFTHQGGVTLAVEFKDNSLRFTVDDSGVGLTGEEIKRLFKPFSQGDDSTTRKFGGTGLGLVLSRRLAEALGGSLELVRSEKNLGSTFVAEIKTALLPTARLIAKEELVYKVTDYNRAHLSGSLLRGFKILLVEDSVDNQTLITSYLKREGALIKTASDGEEGVRLALDSDFDLLLMDIQMPVLDGHKATQRLRHLKYDKPIIALTAHAMREEKRKCMDSGFTDFLTKPVQKKLLIETLVKYTPSYLAH